MYTSDFFKILDWILHIILLITGEIWSKASNLTCLLLVNVFAEVPQVNAEALNIKSYHLRQKHCQGSAEAKFIFIQLPQHFICCGKKHWNLRAVPRVVVLFFLIGNHSMQGWTATIRHGVTRTKKHKNN